MKTFEVSSHLASAVIFPLFGEQKEPRWNFQLGEDGLPVDWVGEDADPGKELHCGWSKWTWGLDESKFTPKMKRRKLTGYGINMGASGLIGIDIDVKEVDGFSHFQDFVDGRDLPKTFTVQTGTGGQHLYYRAPVGKLYSPTVSVLAQAVDTRSKVSYLVGEGSQVKGKSYTEYDSSPIADLPKWLEAYFDQREEEREVDKLPPLDPSEKVTLDGDFPFPFSERALRDAVDSVTHASSHSQALFTGAISCARVGVPLSLVEDSLFRALPRAKQNASARASIHNGYKIGYRELQHDLQTGKRWLSGDKKEGATREQMRITTAKVTITGEDPTPKEPDWDRLDAASYEHTYICERLSKRFRGLFQYVEEMTSFISYDPIRGVSQKIADSTMNNVVRDTLKADYLDAIGAISDARLEDKVEKSLKFTAKRLLNAQTINNAMTGVKGDLTVSIASLNRNQGLVVAANGVVDARSLESSGELKLSPFSQALMETRCSPANYLPETYVLRDTSTWHPKVRALLAAVDKSTRYWLLEQFGKSMTGIYAKMDFITFMSGRSGAGKSSILAAFRLMAGNYAGKVDRKAFKSSGGTNFSLAAYEYLRLAFVEELPENYLNVDSIKDLVNASLLTIEKKFEQPRDIPMEAHTFITANILPRVAQNDEGLWRRIRAMEFNTIHVETEEELERLRGEQQRKLETYEEQVKALTPGDELPPRTDIQHYTLAASDLADSVIRLQPQEFWDCLLTITLTAAGEWYARDRVGVKDPEAVVSYTSDWRAGTDRIFGWLEECVEFDASCASLRTDAYQCFLEWLGDNGASDWGASKFYQALEGHRIFLEANVYYRKGKTTSTVRHAAWTPRRKNRFDNPIARSGENAQHRYYGLRLKQAEILQDFSGEG